MNIGKAIRLVRKQKGITQKKLADKCDLSYNALCRIELGDVFPKKDNINNISEKLGVPISYILFLSIEEQDVPAHKVEAWNAFREIAEKILLEY